MIGVIVPAHDEAQRIARCLRAIEVAMADPRLAAEPAAYRQVGGFRPLVAHEDVGLVAALTNASRSIAWHADPYVLTSARLGGRAPAGMRGCLRNLID